MRRVVFALGFAALVALGALPATAQDEGDTCRVLSGTIDATSVPRFEGDALVGFDVTVTGATGPLERAEITAALAVEQFLPDGSLVFTGEHRFGGNGAGAATFVTADRGITTGSGAVANSLQVVEGGTGFLVTTGRIDLDSGTLALEYHGVHCAAGR